LKKLISIIFLNKMVMQRDVYVQSLTIRKIKEFGWSKRIKELTSTVFIILKVNLKELNLLGFEFIL
jgi:hypothetical protein